MNTKLRVPRAQCERQKEKSLEIQLFFFLTPKILRNNGAKNDGERTTTIFIYHSHLSRQFPHYESMLICSIRFLRGKNI